jgi:hypothetical protein
MNNKVKIFLLSSIIACTSVCFSSCSRGSGCPAETANVRPDRKGNFGKKKGSSNLFPKDMRKKVRVN